MKRLFLILVVFVHINFAEGQQTYICKYIDSLGVYDISSQMDSIKEKLSQKGLPEDLIAGYLNMTMLSPEMFSMAQERIVTSIHDSTFITLNYKPIDHTIQLKMAGNKLLIANGQLYRFDAAENKYFPSVIPDSSQVFVPTHRKKDIMNYSCDEYKSVDGIYRIWVTKSLPSSINPGITVKNIEGCILSFEAKHGNTYTKSSLSSIELIRNTI